MLIFMTFFISLIKNSSWDAVSLNLCLENAIVAIQLLQQTKKESIVQTIYKYAKTSKSVTYKYVLTIDWLIKNFTNLTFDT